MSKYVLLIILSGILLLAPSKNFAQKGNTMQGVLIGVVDVEVIAKELPETAEAEKKIKALGQKYQDTLIQFQNDLEAKLKTYEKQKLMMPADQQQKEEDNLRAMNNQILQYRDAKFGQQGELILLQQKLLEPIRTKIKSAIEKVAKEEKMSFVVDKANTLVLFADDKYDITYKVLDKIKRGKE